MVKIKNVMGITFSGRIGRDMIASSWKGHEYLKRYAVPSNPRTEQQKEVRGIFKEALQAWRNLSPRQKEFYDKIAEGMSGYNVFVGRYIKAVRAGQEPEFPIEMQWKTEDGMPIGSGWLIVRWRSKDIFVDNLGDARGAVALTPSDAPYAFALKKGAATDTVLEIEDLLETDVPMPPESKRLGIRLIADVQPPSSETDGGKR